MKILRLFSVTAFLVFSLNTANAQGLQGNTLNASPSPVPSAASVLGPVISPTCPYENFSLPELFGVSDVVNPNLSVAAVNLMIGGFSPEAIRVFMVAELCGL